MATPTDPARLSVGPLTAPQRQRLEALTAAKMLLNTTEWINGHNERRPLHVPELLDVAQWIMTGDMP